MSKKILLLTLLLLVPFSLYAATTGKIVGKVTDRETGDALPGANVIIEGTSLGAATDISGEYIILNVPVGTYSLRSSFIGYRNVQITNVHISQDLTTEINFELPSEAIEVSEITIVSERPLVSKNATNVVKITTSEEIEVLPLRGFRNVVSTEAGVTNVGGRLYVRGGRREEIATYVDGVYQNLPLTGRASGDIATTAIEEVNFQAGGFNAEYGFANSGVINITSKDGGSQYKLTAEVITDAMLSKTSKNLGTYSYGYKVYNGSLSGPVPGIPNLKFYAALERQDLDDRNPSAFPYQRLAMDSDGNPLDASGNPITFASDETDNPSVIRGWNLDDAFPQYDTDGVIRDYQFDEQGPWENRENKEWLWNVNLTYEFSKALKLKLGGNSSRSEGRDIEGYSPGADFPNVLDGAGIGFALWNTSNNPLLETWQDSYTAKLTHTLGSRTFYTLQANYFRDDFKRSSVMFGDSFWNIGDKGDVISRTGPGSDGLENPYLDQNGIRPRNDPRSADLYSSFGTQPGLYSDRQWSFWGFKFDMTHQLNRENEIKFGAEYRKNNYKNYQVGGYGSSDLHSLAQNLVNVDPNNPNAITAEQAYQNRFADAFGFDVFGNEADVGRDAAKKPVNMAFYLQDKLELDDLVLNFGLRYDYFHPEYDGIKDLENITTVRDPNRGNLLVLDESNFTASEKRHHLSPRLGFSFPVTDRTVFHAQYGKFVQTPELSRMYSSTIQYAQYVQSGNFFTAENPNLDLINTTAYEIGFRQQVGDNAALDVTGYYKDISNYVRLTNLENAFPVPYAIYTSEDFGTVKGLAFTFNMRPANRISASANYTLQYAAGTGSDANTQYNITWQNGRTPTYVAPLDFDQRHNGVINFDFRTRPGDIGGLWGLNMLFNFGSGLSYTPVRPDSEVDPSSNSALPIAQVGSGQGPWIFQMDLKLDKTFMVSGTKFNVYLWAINVTGRTNANWVYPGTGESDNDGYFSQNAGKNFLQTWGSNGRALYEFMLQNPYMVGPPRQLRLGLKLEI